jgi:predicted DNA repair protein MutK
VHGFSADRELPIVWRIARGSIFNKLVILLPAALLLSAFAPWAIAPLLMLGGAYLCYEGAEKVAHWVSPKHHDVAEATAKKLSGEDSAHLEEEKVKGAIKTDFILSAEIMTIALSAIETDSLAFEAMALAVAGIGITIMVYGSVAVIVKADDFGLHLASKGRTALGRAAGRGIVRGMPGFLRALTFVGTLAMLWVGGSIIVHSLAEIGWHGPEHAIDAVAHLADGAGGFAVWAVKALIDGVLGLALGLLLIPVVGKLLMPVLRAVGLGGAGASSH